MAELRRIPFPQLLHRALEEPARTASLFDLPLRKCFRPSPTALVDGVPVDLSARVHGHVAQTPLGPAAGPHAQLAQNVVLSWAAGSRVIELKTVQILDRLRIPRPCIDARTIGFNVEWSQELPLAESLREYVAGWMLIRILRHVDAIGLGAQAAAAAAPVFELSVGYDLAGLTQPAMRDYLARVKDVTPIVDELRGELLAALTGPRRALADLDFDPRMVSCVTLSTFHGCPPGEIEAIARYLLVEHDVDVIVKLNPTLLGPAEVTRLLHDVLGYRALRVVPKAFEGDLEWSEALALARRLDGIARARGRSFGVKMTNTLVVENHDRFFGEKEMYLSGAPLHVLAMACVARFREALGGAIPVSFSGGVDQHNAVDAIACDLVPVTTCTDLLRAGGYGRLPRYLENLEQAMVALGAPDRDELVLRRFGHAAEAARRVLARREPSLHESSLHGPAINAALSDRIATSLAAGSTLARALADTNQSLDSKHLDEKQLTALQQDIVREAGVRNSLEVARRVAEDPRYGAARNSRPPRKVGSSLALFDCLSCDKCVPVCPNDANFEIPTPPESLAFEELIARGDRSRSEGAAPRSIERRAADARFEVTRESQWATFADACNECGNCDVFCPEDGGPYVVKARFFGSREGFEASAHLDGLFVDEAPASAIRVLARVGGATFSLVVPASTAAPAVLEGDGVRARYDVVTGALLGAELVDGAPARPMAGDGATQQGGRAPLEGGVEGGAAGEGGRAIGAVFLTLRTLVRGALDPARVNPVSARLPSLRWPA